MDWVEKLKELVTDCQKRAEIKHKLLEKPVEDRGILFDDDDDTVRASLLKLIAPGSDDDESESRSAMSKKWSLDELLVLIVAKDEDIQQYKSGLSKDKKKTNKARWQWIADRCGQQGVHRTWKQCEIKWNHELPGFKKIRDFERNRPSDSITYWDLSPSERLGRGLPRTYNKEVYNVIEKHLGHHASINRGNILVDSSIFVGTQEDQEANVGLESALLEEATNSPAPACGSGSGGSSTGKRKRGRSHMSSTVLETSKSPVQCLNNMTAECAEQFKHAELDRDKRNELSREIYANSALQIADALRGIGSAIQSLSASLARNNNGL